MNSYARPSPLVPIGAELAQYGNLAGVRLPTAHAATDLPGLTEVRAGNYVFFDLVMAGIGVCTLDGLALSVVVTVIGNKPGSGWVLTDGGWMALSRDHGALWERTNGW